MAIRNSLALLAVVWIAACMEPNGTTQGISSGPNGPSNVAGSWRYSTSNVTNPPLVCASTGTTLTLTQQGSTVTGTYSGGTLTCTAGGAPQSYTMGSGTIGSGTVSGSSVTLDLDTSAWHSTGTVNGNSMGGSVTMQVLVNNMTYTLTGSWAATRQ